MLADDLGLDLDEAFGETMDRIECHPAEATRQLRTGPSISSSPAQIERAGVQPDGEQKRHPGTLAHLGRTGFP